MTTDAASPALRFRLGRLLVDTTPLKESHAYRMLFCAHAASLLVYGVLTVATTWQAFTMTGSSLQVAGLGFFAATGLIGGSLLGGPLADRHDRRRLMIASRTAFLGVVLVLLANAWVDRPMLWVLYGASAVSGFVGGISAPALLAARPTLVGREKLPAAAALSAIASQAGGMIGPFAAGLLIAGPGLLFCYGVVAVGAGLTPVLLWFLPPLPPSASHPPKGLGALIDGWRFLRSSPVASGALLLDFAAAFLALPYVLVPQIATQLLDGGPQTAGVLYAAPAAGALIAAVSSGWTSAIRRPGLVLSGMTLTWGSAVFATGLSSQLAVILLLFALAGFADTIAEILRSALLHGNTPDGLRGRVSSVLLIESTLGPALGGLQLGAVAKWFSPSLALICGGGACIAFVAAVTARLCGLRASQRTSDRAAA